MWENDKLNGPSCRIYNAQSGNYYTGPMEEGKMSGKGRMFDAERDEVMEGDFEHNKKQGEGFIFQRSGHVLKGNFRNNQMEGTFENMFKINKKQVSKVFANSQLTNNVFIAVNKKTEVRV